MGGLLVSQSTDAVYDTSGVLISPTPSATQRTRNPERRGLIMTKFEYVSARSFSLRLVDTSSHRLLAHKMYMALLDEDDRPLTRS